VSTQIYSVFLLFIISIFVFIVLDVLHMEDIRSEIFDNSRQANADVASSSIDNYNQNEIINEIDIFEMWLIDYVENSDTSFNKVELDFGVVNVDPHVILVRVVGSNEYVYLGGDAAITYINGVLIEDLE